MMRAHSSPAQMKVLAVLAVLVPIGVGFIGLIVAAQAPEGKESAANDLQTLSFISISIGVLLALLIVGIRALTARRGSRSG